MRDLLPLTLLFVCPGLWACGGGVEFPPAPTPPVVTVTPSGDGSEWVHPPVELPGEAVTSRSVRRLTTMMLARSLPVVAGPEVAGEDGPDDPRITWTFAGDVALETDPTSFGFFDRTLGRPDYVSVTTEAAEPSPLYLKFMDDMARDVCAKMAEADAADPSATGAHARFAPLDTVGTDGEVRDNLRYLKLRFWGEYIDPGDDESVTGLETLYRSVVSHVEEVPVNPAPESQNQSPRVPSREGWGAVCVALLSSPAFHLY